MFVMTSSNKIFHCLMSQSTPLGKEKFITSLIDEQKITTFMKWQQAMWQKKSHAISLAIYRDIVEKHSDSPD